MGVNNRAQKAIAKDKERKKARRQLERKRHKPRNIKNRRSNRSNNNNDDDDEEDDDDIEIDDDEYDEVNEIDDNNITDDMILRMIVDKNIDKITGLLGTDDYKKVKANFYQNSKRR